jgi:hypothetical protein
MIENYQTKKPLDDVLFDIQGGFLLFIEINLVRSA